jgi:outer membrane receptor protein involved in Fe transport
MRFFVAGSLRFFAVLSLAVMAVPAAFAQQTINYASVSGIVTDPSGAVVVGATVTARATDTNLTSATNSDNQGRFRFPYLKVGQYEIAVRQQGFAETTRSVALTVGAAFELTIPLQMQSAHETVTVDTTLAVIETARTQMAGTVMQNEVKNLPLNGRNFLDLTLLVPGVSPTNTASTQLFAETSAVPGQGISVASQRNFSNSFITDGLSANDDAAGLVISFYPLDSVQEFQVVTSGGQAEFGRALGGYINMVTKSGTNQQHGDVYGFFRNQDLNASNALTHQTLPLTQGQYGASMGGPVIKDRTFYFANFEQRLLNQAGSPVITITPANVTAIDARLTALNFQGPLISTGEYSNPVHMSNVLGKIDHRVSNNDQLSARYSFYDVNADNSRGVGGLSAVSAAAGLNDIDHTVAVSNIYSFSSGTVNETRAQFTNSNLLAAPNDLVGPAVSIAGVASFGRLSGSPTGRLDRLFELVDNVSHQKGAHALRTGVDFLYNDLTITFPQSISGSYSFSSLANFLSGNYSTFTQTFGNPVVQQSNPSFGIYAQDEWRVNPRLTLNAGVRYDLEYLKTITTDTNNVSPRFGFAWSPFANNHTLVRGGAGIFYDRVALRPLANALLSADNTTNGAQGQLVSTILNFGQVGAPAFPNIIPTAPTVLPVSFTTMDPNIQNAYAEQAGLEIEQQLTSKSTLSINYQHLRGAHLIVSENLNTPTCTSKVDPVNLCRANPAFQNNKQYTPAADSEYDGVSVSYIQRPVKWGSFRVSYTYSKALDDVSEFFFSAPLNNFNVHQDWGRSDDDQRHRLVFDSTIHTSMASAHSFWENLTHGFQLSGILSYYSAFPFNIVTGANTIQGTSGRPCIGLSGGDPNCTSNIGLMIGRNTGTGFDSFNLNTRLSRTFAIGERIHLEAMAEMFNLLNHPNYQVPNNSFGAGPANIYPNVPLPTFGQPTAVADPREAQLALRINF